MSDELVFKDPRPDGRGRWVRFAATVKQNPNRWVLAKSQRTANNAALSTLQARLKALGLEATQRRDGEFVELYVRYVNGDEA